METAKPHVHIYDMDAKSMPVVLELRAVVGRLFNQMQDVLIRNGFIGSHIRRGIYKTSLQHIFVGMGLHF